MANASWPTVSSVVIASCWGLFVFVWVAGALYNLRRMGLVRRARGPRALVLIVGVGAWRVLRFVPEVDWQRARVGWPAVRAVGASMLLVSTAFALWARFVLGVLWSSAAVVKQGHVLRTNGPYAITRHPIYTGILGMLLGTALLEGIGAWGVVFLVALAAVEGRIMTEERLLTEAFGEQYPRYRAAVPQLVPGLRHRKHASGAS